MPLGALLLAAAATAARAGGGGGVLTAQAIVGAPARGFRDQRTISLFQEAGTIESAYSAGLGAGLEVGYTHGLGERWGVVAGVALLPRRAAADHEARLPHPLYLGRPRVVQKHGDGGFSRAEVALHTAVGRRGRLGPGRYTIFAGPSLFWTTVELVDRAETQETYPYDEVPFTLLTAHARTWAIGLQLGARVARPLGRRTALCLQARYSGAPATLRPNATDRTRITTGGWQVGAGIEWRARR